MIVRRNGQPHAIYTRDPNAPYMNDAGKAACRLPSGHPEAFFEAFANIYRAAYDNMALRGPANSTLLDGSPSGDEPACHGELSP